MNVKVPIEKVELDKSELNIFIGDNQALVVTILPENSTDKSVVWGSSNPEVATVDENGMVTAVAEGSVVITATVGEKSATCQVNIHLPPPTESIIFEEITENEKVVGYAVTEITDKTVIDVVIPAVYNGLPVLQINDGAFENCVKIQKIIIPNSITSIGSEAFIIADEYERKVLTSIIVDKGNTTYHSEANCLIETVSKTMILGCNTSVIPVDGSVTSIGSYAFFCSTGLTSIIIPDSITSIGFCAFAGCSGITNMTIPNSVTDIEDGAFSSCTGLTSIVIPDSVASIKFYTFLECTSLNSVTIPNSVTDIGYGAFADCIGLTSITIPNSVTSIGEDAFSGCSGLTSIIIPDSVTSIGEGAFSCGGLTSINVVDNKTYHSEGNCVIETASKTLIVGCNTSVIPSDGSVTSIGNYAFYGCGGLTSITIPDSVTSIGEYAFLGCSGLTSLTIGKGVTIIENKAFYGCSGLTSITIPDSVTSIGDEAFSGCRKLTSVTIGNSVTNIESMAFRGCCRLVEVYNKSNLNIRAGSDYYGEVGTHAKNVYTTEGGSKLTTDENGFVIYDGNTLVNYIGKETKITIPNTIVVINQYTFYGCSGLTSITIPDSVTSIGDEAFNGCSGLTSITIPDGVTSIGGGAFLYCGGLASVAIPDSVTNIRESAFRGCTGLTSVNIGSGVMSIGNGAFVDCSGLTSITVESGNTNYHSEGNCLIQTASKTLVLGCKMSEIPMDGSVTSIGNSAFSGCSGLISIAISDSISSIGSDAFYCCSGLTNIIISDSVTSIGASAFYGCETLSYNEYDNALYLGNENNPYVVLVKAKDKSITTCTINDNTKIIQSYAFYGCSGLTSITIPDSVTSIGSDVFYGCNNLHYDEYDNALYLGNVSNPYIVLVKAKDKSITSCTINDSTKIIYENAFEDCSGLTSITIPDSVTIIGDDAFSGCRGLTSITIGNGVASIGNFAFYLCNRITSVYYTGDIAGWCNISGLYNLMINGSSNKKLYINNQEIEGDLIIPNGVTIIGYGAFADCRGLKSITIPDSVTIIGDDAFNGCSGLTSITIPDGVTSIGGGAFLYCSGLTSVTIGNSVTSIGHQAFNGCISLTTVYYKGSAEDMAKISIGYYNSKFENAKKYYYSENEPALNSDLTQYDGDYWHYGENNEIVVWKKEN